MPKKYAKYIAKKEATGPRRRTDASLGADTAEGRGMFPPRKKKKVKNNRPVAHY